MKFLQSQPFTLRFFRLNLRSFLPPLLPRSAVWFGVLRPPHSSLQVPLLPVYPRLTVSACFRLSLIASNRLRRRRG